jgi:type I restriction enzyme, S subunit
MKNGWELKKLSDVCQVRPPKKEAKEQLTDEDIVSFVPMEDLDILSKNFIAKNERALKEVYKSYTYFREGDVLLAKITPCFENGKLGVAHNLKNGIGFGSSEYIVLRSKGELIPDYLFYFLSKEEFRFSGQKVMTGAVGHKRVPLDFVENTEIPYPKDLPEQNHIVAQIEEAFEIIDKAKENVERNLQNASELFESYLQKMFLNTKDTWEMKKWGELCDFVRGPFGGSLKKSVFKEKGYVVYEQKHAIHDHFNQLRYFIDEDKFNEMIRFEVKPGDLIMSCSGVTLGRVAVVPDGIPRGIINQALLKLTPKKGVSADFLKHWLRSKIFQDIIFEYSGGAAIPNVPSAKILKNIEIPLPKIEEQNEIVNEIETVLSETKRLEEIYKKKLTNLDELKQSILKKAFNGKL